MTDNELLYFVKEMRKAQRNYFKTRTGAWLEESKKLERIVDRAIEQREQPALGLTEEGQ